MRLLRWSIAGVAVFILLFSLFFSQNTYIFMFFAITGNFWLGGAGAVIIGGLYWKRGTTAGAFTSVIMAAVITVVYFVGKQMGVDWEFKVHEQVHEINEQWIFFITMITTLIAYVIVSLLTCKKPCDMEKLLHRGKYAVTDDKTEVSDSEIPRWQAVLGIGHDFNLKDKIVYLAISGWTFIWAGIFVVGTIYALIASSLTDDSWAKLWHVYAWLIFGVGAFTTVWLLWGGLIDLSKMFHRLNTITRDESDDGTVEKKDYST
jgi:SSS family solute:Na+ symporter